MITLIVVGLALLIVPGLLILVGDHLLSGRESCTVSIRELPNIAADIGARDTVRP